MALLLGSVTALSVGGCQEVGARRNIQEANKLYYNGKYEEAIKLYDDALKVQPDLAIGWFNLGLAHRALIIAGAKTPENDAHANGAIDAFQRYIKMEPTDPQARDYLLSTEIDAGKVDLVIGYFKEQLAKNPNDLGAIGQIASMNTQAGRYDEAIVWHKKRAELDPKVDGKADTWYSIGVLDWKRLYKHPDIAGPERQRIADEGIGWLQKADGIRKGHKATLAYINLLYRERALAHGASWGQAVDTATALFYAKQAADAAKAK